MDKFATVCPACNPEHDWEHDKVVAWNCDKHIFPGQDPWYDLTQAKRWPTCGELPIDSKELWDLAVEGGVEAEKQAVKVAELEAKLDKQQPGSMRASLHLELLRREVEDMHRALTDVGAPGDSSCPVSVRFNAWVARQERQALAVVGHGGEEERRGL